MQREKNYVQLRLFLFIIGVILITTQINCLAKISDDVEMNEQNLASFFDEIVTKQMKENELAGVTISVVKDDEILFNKAYGYQNTEVDKVYDVDTITRIGSITKVFVWQSILMLYKDGKLDLNDPIDKYIPDLSYMNPYDEPITIRHLMTHTAGFEDELSSIFKYNSDPNQALLDDFRRVIYEPGDIVAYSNYGASIGGLIVERVSGIELDDYISQTIFEPLNMDRSTLREQARSHFDNVSYGHFKYRNELHKIEDPPACYPASGAMSTTSKNMANYMIMHLNGGRFNGQQIIKREVINLMHETAYASHDELAGLTLGMMEWKRNDLEILWHSGGNATFKSMILLIPQEKVGLFISYNTAHAEKSRDELRGVFLDTFFPYDLKIPTPIDNYHTRAKGFEGYYKEARVSYSNSDKLLYLASRSKKVTANKDGTLSFRGAIYIEVQPNIFREVGGQGKLIFEEDNKGKPYRAYQDDEPHEAYIKMSIFETPPVVGGTLILLLVLNMVFITRVIYQKRKKKVCIYGNKVANKLIISSGILLFVFICLIICSLAISVLCNPEILVQAKIPLTFKLTLMIPVIALSLLFIGMVKYISNILKGNIMKVNLFYGISHCLVISGIIIWLIYMKLFGVYII